MKELYDISIEDVNSGGICAVARELGITHMRKIGGGYISGREGNPDA